MNNIERRDNGILYISDESVFEQQKRARRLTQKLNTMDRSDFEGISAVVKELLGKSEGAFINPPFYCDYGFNIEVGKNLFCNYNCTIIDVGKVVIGDNCQIAPGVSIYTAGHPVHPAARNTAYEYGIDITIGNNVWIGGNTVILPGVHIGDNVVIGAGSVVTKDIPSWYIAAGNPCKLIRKITETDRYTYFKGVVADAECEADMRRMWEENTDPVKCTAPCPAACDRQAEEQHDHSHLPKNRSFPFHRPVSSVISRGRTPLIYASSALFRSQNIAVRLRAYCDISWKDHDLLDSIL